MAYGSVMFYSTNPWLEIRDTNELLDIFSPGLTFPVRPIFSFSLNPRDYVTLTVKFSVPAKNLSLFQFFWTL